MSTPVATARKWEGEEGDRMPAMIFKYPVRYQDLLLSREVHIRCQPPITGMHPLSMRRPTRVFVRNSHPPRAARRSDTTVLRH